MNRDRALAVFVSLLFAVVLLPAWAAHTTDVSGKVVDKLNNDKPIPGAHVTYTNLKTGKSYAAVTDEQGKYLLKKIQTGKYRIEAVNATGEKIFTIENAEVNERWTTPPPEMDPLGNHKPGVQETH